MMNEVSPLIVQLLEWISVRPRSYTETMDAWRSSCPRLTTWEDALIGDLVQVEVDVNAPQELMVVKLTTLGRSVLKNVSGDRKKAMRS